METIALILSFVGALALFLYGMKIMSEGLEKIAGNRMRDILGKMTKNRFMGVLTGIAVTALIQSSSATTVMVVSFVNAGLMSLGQAISVIMGANIGTTVTAWIVSLIGFEVSISAFSLPLMALSLPLLFSKRTSARNWGEFIVGFAFLFMGLKMLSDSAEALHIGDYLAQMMSVLPCDKFWVIPLFILLGAILTMMMQSSSASMAITLMLFDMNIPGFGFAQAAALAMGQNIGTTVTAFLASLTGNTQAKRAALAHVVFNVTGVLIILLAFYPTIHGIEWVVNKLFADHTNNMFMLSVFHTWFNVLNTLLLIWFVPQIEKLVCRVLPSSTAKEVKHLRFISGGLLSTAELSILQAQKEIGLFAERCHRMVGMVNSLSSTTDPEDFAAIYARIEKYEQITDRMEVEIADYLGKVSEGRLSANAKQTIRRMLRQIDELESIGDVCYNLGRTLYHHRDKCAEPFLADQIEHMLAILALCDKAMTYMEEVLMMNEEDVDEGIILRSENMEEQINTLRNTLRAHNLSDVDEGRYTYQQGVFYSDFIAHAEKMGDHIVNVVETYVPTPMRIDNDN